MANRQRTQEVLTSPKSNQGFTLVEMLVVIAIIGILAAMLVGFLNKRGKGVPVKVSSPTPATGAKVNASIDSYDVQLLFTVSGMKVYRFSDAGHYVYIVDGRNSKANWVEITPNGKSSTEVPVESDTVK